MSTLNDILQTKEDTNTIPDAIRRGRETRTGVSATVPTLSTGTQQPAVSSAPTETKKELSYTELFKALNPNPQPTQEELEKERKRQKRAAVITAISDGLSALANMHYVNRNAPNMYDGKNTLSERLKAQYDKLLKDRNDASKEYYSGYVKAMMADEDKAHRERAWERQLGLDEEARQKYKESIEHRDKREAIADERYDKELEYKKELNEKAEQRDNRNYAFQVQQHNDNKTLQEGRNAATAARAVRGNQLGFSDGKGNQVSIYENVWKGSMQQVYDAMLSDLAPADEKEKARWERQMKKYDTPQKKEDFVKQNWHKSPKASAIMLALSKLDPANMTSEVSSGLGWGNSNSNDNETDW